MRFHRFFVAEKIGEQSEFAVSDQKLIHQWRKVLRFNKGDRVFLFDNSGSDFESEIVSLNSDEALFCVKNIRVGLIPKNDLHVYFSLIKKDRMEWLIEKTVELGVSHLHPIISERSEKKGFDLVRARKIAIEASEQSGRSILPIIHEPVSLIEALDSLPSPVFAFDPSGSPLKPESCQLSGASLFIGPEGGFTDNEVSLFKSKGMPIYSLGPLTLRAETSALAVVAKFLL